jgi:hypothetical protein
MNQWNKLVEKKIGLQTIINISVSNHHPTLHTNRKKPENGTVNLCVGKYILYNQEEQIN